MIEEKKTERIRKNTILIHFNLEYDTNDNNYPVLTHYSTNNRKKKKEKKLNKHCFVCFDAHNQ